MKLHFFVAFVCIAFNSFSAANKKYDRLIVEAHELLASQKATEAAESFRSAIQLEPKLRLAWIGLSSSLAAVGDSIGAAKILDKALQTDSPKNDPKQKKKYSKPPFASYALSDSELLVQAAIMSYSVENYKKTESIAERAILLDPSNAHAHYMLAVSRLVQGIVDTVTKTLFQKAVSLVSKDTSDPQQLAQYVFALSICLDRLGDLESAIAALDQYIALKPLCPKGRANKGDLLSQLGKHDLAERAYTEAAEREPNSEAHLIQV